LLLPPPLTAFFDALVALPLLPPAAVVDAAVVLVALEEDPLAVPALVDFEVVLDVVEVDDTDAVVAVEPLFLVLLLLPPAAFDDTLPLPFPPAPAVLLPVAVLDPPVADAAAFVFVVPFDPAATVVAVAAFFDAAANTAADGRGRYGSKYGLGNGTFLFLDCGGGRGGKSGNCPSFKIVCASTAASTRFEMYSAVNDATKRYASSSSPGAPPPIAAAAAAAAAVKQSPLIFKNTANKQPWRQRNRQCRSRSTTHSMRIGLEVA